MTKKWIAINLLLLVITGLLVRQVRNAIHDYKVKNRIENIQPPGREVKQEKILPQPAPPRTYQAAEFSVIPQKMVFAENRTNVEEVVAPAAPPAPPPLTQKPILVGTSISDNQQWAMIIDPMQPQDKGRRAQSKKVGDTYQGYTITTITADRIVLVAGTQQEIIPLHEGTKRGFQGKTPVQAVRLVSIGGGGNAGSSSGGRQTTTMAAAPSSGGAPTVAGGAKPPTATGTPASGTAPTQSTPGSGARNPAQQTNPGVIRTPFGDIQRPNRPN
jgi:hypothetical protein